VELKHHQNVQPISWSQLTWIHQKLHRNASCYTRLSLQMRVLYMFGLNEDGQCGVPYRPEHNGRYFPVPLSLPFKVSIASVSAGSRHTLALTMDGDVYSWGWGHLGQLGLGDARSVSQPTKIPTLKSIICISAGGVHSACIDSENYCYTWGSCTYGQLGLGIEVTETRKCVVPVPSIVTLRSSSDVKGEKYACFKDNEAESGAIETCVPPQPQKGSFPANALRATRISCGGLHTAAIDLRGSVYCWGKADSGQTGYADWYRSFSSAVCSPRRVEGLGPRVRSNSLGSPYSSPRMSSKSYLFPLSSKSLHPSLPSSKGGVPSEGQSERGFGVGLGLRAVEVSCGGFHTMVTLEDGSVFAMGKQDFGMLGTGGSELSYCVDIGVEAPTMVMYSPATAAPGPTVGVAAGAGAEMTPVRAVEVSTGGWHTAIVNTDGALYMCGKGEYGRLGLGDEKSRMGLTLVSPPQYVAVRSSMNAPTLPTVPENAALSGSSAPTAMGTPVVLPAPGTSSTVGCAARLALSGRAVLSPGATTSPDTSSTASPHSDGDDSAPVSPHSLVDEVTCVSAGGSHTIWATASGRVYTVGRLDGGRLGVGYISAENPQRVVDLDGKTTTSGLVGAGKKVDRLQHAVDITAFLYTCCAGKEPCVHRAPPQRATEARLAPPEPYKILQVAAGGSHSAVLVDFPNVTHDGAYEDFLNVVNANVLCEEARVDLKQIPTVK
jgi:alpha-tubulin suppressor-like RCC1 family protein